MREFPVNKEFSELDPLALQAEQIGKAIEGRYEWEIESLPFVLEYHRFDREEMQCRQTMFLE